MKTFLKTALFIILNTLLCGCALLTKADPLNTRYFSIEKAPVNHNAARPEDQKQTNGILRLKLGRITGARYLEEQLVYRDSAHEVGYYRERRWTEPPENFLERLLSKELFETRGTGHVLGGGGPTLDVQLTALDEIRKPAHLVRIQVIVALHNEKAVLWEETLDEERQVIDKSGDDPAGATVSAFSQAMENMVNRIAERTVAVLKLSTE